MFAPLLRRLAVVTLGLALALGPLAHAGAAMEANMGMPANMEMPMHADAGMAVPEPCELCGDGAASMDAGACFAGCTMLGAILPSAGRLADALGRALIALESSPAADRRRPPDLHPPKFLR